MFDFIGEAHGQSPSSGSPTRWLNIRIKCFNYIIDERGPGFPGPRPLYAGNGEGAPAAEGAGPREKGLTQNVLPFTLRADKRLSISRSAKITNGRLFTADDRQAGANCSLSFFGIYGPFAFCVDGAGHWQFHESQLETKDWFRCKNHKLRFAEDL